MRLQDSHINIRYHSDVRRYRQLPTMIASNIDKKMAGWCVYDDKSGSIWCNLCSIVAKQNCLGSIAYHSVHSMDSSSKHQHTQTPTQTSRQILTVFVYQNHYVTKSLFSEWFRVVLKLIASLKIGLLSQVSKMVQQLMKKQWREKEKKTKKQKFTIYYFRNDGSWPQKLIYLLSTH